MYPKKETCFILYGPKKQKNDFVRPLRYSKIKKYSHPQNLTNRYRKMMGLWENVSPASNTASFLGGFWLWKFSGRVQGGPLLVTNGVISPPSGVMGPQLKNSWFYRENRTHRLVWFFPGTYLLYQASLVSFFSGPGVPPFTLSSPHLNLGENWRQHLYHCRFSRSKISVFRFFAVFSGETRDFHH